MKALEKYSPYLKGGAALSGRVVWHGRTPRLIAVINAALGLPPDLLHIVVGRKALTGPGGLCRAAG